MFLFLFDTDDRKMYGVFGATSNGGMNIVPEAFSSSGNTYPAQVQESWTLSVYLEIARISFNIFDIIIFGY